MVLHAKWCSCAALFGRGNDIVASKVVNSIRCGRWYARYPRLFVQR